MKGRLNTISLRKNSQDALIVDRPDILTISQWLGHASGTTTNRYVTTDLEIKRKAIEQAQAIDHKTDDAAALWRTDAPSWLGLKPCKSKFPQQRPPANGRMGKFR